MITEDEFRVAVAPHRDWPLKFALFAFLAVFFLLPAAFAAVIGYVPDDAWQGGAFAGVSIGLFASLFLALIFVAKRKYHHAASDPRLFCPHCGRSLLTYRTRVIATGNCPHCGGRVLSLPVKGKKQLWRDPEL